MPGSAKQFDAIRETDSDEKPGFLWFGEAKNLSKESGRRVLVMGRNKRVIEKNRHQYTSVFPANPQVSMLDEARPKNTDGLWNVNHQRLGAPSFR